MRVRVRVSVSVSVSVGVGVPAVVLCSWSRSATKVALYRPAEKPAIR